MAPIGLGVCGLWLVDGGHLLRSLKGGLVDQTNQSDGGRIWAGRGSRRMMEDEKVRAAMGLVAVHLGRARAERRRNMVGFVSLSQESDVVGGKSNDTESLACLQYTRVFRRGLDRTCGCLKISCIY